MSEVGNYIYHQGKEIEVKVMKCLKLDIDISTMTTQHWPWSRAMVEALYREHSMQVSLVCPYLPNYNLSHHDLVLNIFTYFAILQMS